MVGHAAKQSKFNQKDPAWHEVHILGASVLHITHKLELQGTHICVVVDFVVVGGHAVTQDVKLKND